MRVMNAESFRDAPVISNERRKAFADAYLRSGSATSAAKEAGYSPRSASAQGSQLLKHADISAYIDYHKSKATEIAGTSKTRITEELSRLAFSNVADFTRLNSEGDLEVDFSGATREQLSAVSGVKVKKRKIYSAKGELVGEEHQSEFKLWDKIRAAELLGKDIGMFKEPEQKIVVDVADRLLAARQRIRAAMEAGVIEHSDD